MEYTYEFLKKCNGLRFRATVLTEQVEGIVKADDSPIVLCYGKETLGNPDYFTRSKRVYLGDAQRFELVYGDLEIIPRDPETYKDWQVGDKMKNSYYKVREVIFRCGEAVFCKNLANGEAIGPFTCEDLFRYNYRLILTDIEKQIIEENKKAEWKPQDGDILSNGRYVVIYSGTEKRAIITYAVCDTETSCLLAPKKGTGWGYTYEYHPANDKEKQALFDSLAKNGKRWNAEKKVVEDIPKETKTAKYDFTKFAPVLVRNSPLERWRVEVFYYMQNPSCFPFVMTDETEWSLCLPLNEKTMHLIGTNDNYEEEQS